MATNSQLTENLLGVHVVEEAVGGELGPILAPDIMVQHLQLGLALVKLGEVALLQGNPGMHLVDLQRENWVLAPWTTQGAG